MSDTTPIEVINLVEFEDEPSPLVTAIENILEDESLELDTTPKPHKYGHEHKPPLRR